MPEPDNASHPTPGSAAGGDAAPQDTALKPGTWAWRVFWFLALLTLAGIAAFVLTLRPDPGLWISLIVVWLVFWLALGLVAIVSKEPSAKDIGVALLTGLVLAGAAFVLNFVLEEALASRDRERRESETKLAINRREQFVFRGEDFRDFDLTGMAMVSSDTERFDLSFADLTGANFSQAEMRRVLLRNADLTGADLSSADLAQANLRGAVLTGADFSGANLSGADLTGAVGFVEGSDTDAPAVLSAETRCPGSPDDEEPVLAVFSEDGSRFTCSGTAADVQRAARQLFLVSRGAAAGTVVGRVIATDLDADEIVFGVPDAAESPPFAVDPRTGVITVARPLEGPDAPDARTALVVEVGDGVNPPQRLDVVIVIEDDNSPPVAEVSYLVRFDSPVGTRIGQIEAPDNWQGRHRFTIEAGDSSGLFDLGDANGVLTINGKPQAGTSYVLNVRIGDPDNPPTATLPVRVTVIAENRPPQIVTMEPLIATAGAEPGTTIGSVEAEDPDGDALTFALVEDAALAGIFVIDPATGAVAVGPEGFVVGQYVLTVVVTDAGIPSRSTEGKLTVTVEQALARAATQRYLVADQGMLDVGEDDGLLTEEQRAAGLTAQLTTRPRAGRLQGNTILPSGGFSYSHVTAGVGPDSFGYRTIDAAGQPGEPAEVEIAVVVPTPSGIDSTSEAGTTAVRLDVAGIDGGLVDFTLASGNPQLLELQPGGAVVSLVAGDELFDVAPWHDLEVTVTDRESERSLGLPLTVTVPYVVAPGDSLTALAGRALATAAAAGAPCGLTTAEYVAQIREASDVGPLDPGDVLVFPDCRPAASG